MANATATPTVNPYPNGLEITPQKARLWGTVAIGPAGASYVANGLPIAFSGLKSGANGPVVTAFFYSATSGYTYVYDPVHATIRIFQGGSAVSEPQAELAAAALPAAVTSDTIYFEVVLNKVGGTEG